MSARRLHAFAPGLPQVYVHLTASIRLTPGAAELLQRLFDLAQVEKQLHSSSNGSSSNNNSSSSSSNSSSSSSNSSGSLLADAGGNLGIAVQQQRQSSSKSCSNFYLVAPSVGRYSVLHEHLTGGFTS